MKLPDPQIIDVVPGLRLVYIHHRHTGAGIFGVTVRAGSADETPDNYGLAHFVEHTIFKGTRKRSSWHIINRMEAVGGELNAYTTKEETVVYTLFPAGNASRAIELISDLIANSVFPAKELDKERQVVIDEINSYRDTPAEAIFDDFEEYAFAGSPLAHNILGTPESVMGLDSEACRRFLSRNYRRNNIILFYSGSQPAMSVAALCKRHFAELPLGESAIPVSLRPVKKSEIFNRVEHLDTHQCHVVKGVLTPGFDSDDRHAVALLANIVGGPGMNSLLNVELRERRGLVYSVEASTAMYTGVGLLTVYFGCDTEDLDKCNRLCEGVFRKIADGSGLSARRFEMAKKQYLGQYALACENRENRVMALARAALFRGQPATVEDTVEAIHSITLNDIASIARDMCNASSLTFMN